MNHKSSTRPAVKQFTSVALAKDVHTEHCCSIHGCKYAYDQFPEFGKICTVSNGHKKQSYPCESCFDCYEDEPHYAIQNGTVELVDRGKDKKQLLDKVRQFLWFAEHFDGEHGDEFAEEIMCSAHQLRVKFDEVFK